MSKQQELGTLPIPKLLMQYSVPAIIGMIVNALYNIVDRMFIGNIEGVGPFAIAGVGLAMPILTIVLAFGMLAGIGTTASISLHLGRGNRQKAERVLGNGLVLSVLFSVIITAISLFYAEPILQLFGASDATLGYALDYTTILLIGSTFTIVGFGMNATIRADGNPKMSALFMIAGCVINIILDYVFIFMFGWGIEGAAVATVISQAVTTLLVIWYYTMGPSVLKFKLQQFKLEMSSVKMIVAIGMSPFAMQIAASVVQVAANHSLQKYGGDIAIGAMTIIQSVSMFFLMPIFGINQGSQPIIGFNYGAKQYERVKKALLLSMGAGTVILIGGFVLVEAFPKFAISLFNNDPELLNMAVVGMRIFLVALPIIAIPIIGANYFQSIGKARIAMIVSLLRQVIVLIPLLIILPKIFGLTGVWLAGPISDIVATIVTIYFLGKEKGLLRFKRTITEEKAAM